MSIRVIYIKNPRRRNTVFSFTPFLVEISCKTSRWNQNPDEHEEVDSSSNCEDYDKSFSGSEILIEFSGELQSDPECTIEIPIEDALDFANKLLFAAKMCNRDILE